MALQALTALEIVVFIAGGYANPPLPMRPARWRRQHSRRGVLVDDIDHVESYG
jgi:hypothetical protein